RRAGSCHLGRRWFLNPPAAAFLRIGSVSPLARPSPRNPRLRVDGDDRRHLDARTLPLPPGRRLVAVGAGDDGAGHGQSGCSLSSLFSASILSTVATPPQSESRVAGKRPIPLSASDTLHGR